MRKLLCKALFLSLVFVPVPAMAGTHIGFSLSLPSIIFEEPPELVVLPGTSIYVVPDEDDEIFFYSGWWWRPWEGRWYRSRYYDSGWSRYRRTPSFYREIPSGWRNDYRHNRWRGEEWNYRRTPHRDVQRNWQKWEKSRYWEHQDRRLRNPDRDSRNRDRDNRNPDRDNRNRDRDRDRNNPDRENRNHDGQFRNQGVQIENSDRQNRNPARQIQNNQKLIPNPNPEGQKRNIDTKTREAIEAARIEAEKQDKTRQDRP